MIRKAAIWLPILIGAGTGGLLALAGKSDDAPGDAPLAAETRSEAGSAALRRNAPAESAVPSDTASSAPGSAGASPPDAPSPSALSATPSSTPARAPERAPPSSTPGAPAIDLRAPSTAEELLRAEVRCNEKSPEDCEKAALALDSGALGARDTERAERLRRIALTLYVKQCESSRVLACARLAEMYANGVQVRKNARSAEALRQRVTEICARKPREAGCSFH